MPNSADLFMTCGILLLLAHQRGIAQKLLERIDAELAVDVLVVGLNRAFLDGYRFGDLFDVQTVQIIVEDLPLGRCQRFDAV